MHPTTPQRLKERSLALAKEQARDNESLTLVLPCGCQIKEHNAHGILVRYCRRHSTFIFSPRHDGTDVFYFVTEDQRP
jgi:hypothetical protein